MLSQALQRMSKSREEFAHLLPQTVQCEMFLWPRLTLGWPGQLELLVYLDEVTAGACLITRAV